MSSHLTKTQPVRFGVGTACIVKRGKLPALIIDAMGEKRWKVELLDEETGKLTGSTLELKSQQLRNAKTADNHPLLRADSSSETSIAVDEIRQPESGVNNNSLTQVRLQDSIEGVELTLVQESQQVLANSLFTGDPVIQELENDPEPGTQELENNEGHPVIHQNAHRRLGIAAQATVALLASLSSAGLYPSPLAKAFLCQALLHLSIKYLTSLLMMNPMVMVKFLHPPVLIKRKILVTVTTNQMVIMNIPHPLTLIQILRWRKI